MRSDFVQASAVESAAVVLDQTAFDKLTERFGEELLDRALRMFFGETNDGLRTLRRLSCQADRQAIAYEAHSLKGSAGTFGLCELSRLAASLECDAETISASDYARTLDRLDAAYASSRAQFPSVIATQSVLEKR